MKGKFYLLACLLVGGSLAGIASANDQVVNGGFENPTPDNTWHYENSDGAYLLGGFEGWTTGYGFTGVWAPNLGATTFSSLPGGTQAGWASENGDAAMMYQVIAGATIQSGDTFDLTGYIGNRDDLRRTYGLNGAGWMELLTTGGDVLATSGYVLASPGEFEFVDLSYTVDSSNPYMGQGLMIELGNESGSQASFDNIALSSSSANSTPGPMAVAPFAIGLAGALRRRRK